MLPNGTTRTTGLIILIVGSILPLFGWRLSDAAPIEMELIVAALIPAIGTIVTVIGEIRAKSVMWVSKNN